MLFDYETYINLLESLVSKTISEQDASGASTTSAPSSAPSPPAAYPTVTKWETGLTRSVANQIDYKAKWKDLNKLTRGKANTLL